MVETEPKLDGPFPPENREVTFARSLPKKAIQLLIEYYRLTREFISLLKLPLTAEIIKKIANSRPTLSQQPEAKHAVNEKIRHYHPPPPDLEAVSSSVSDIVGSRLTPLIHFAECTLEASQITDFHSDLEAAIEAVLDLDRKITAFSQEIASSPHQSIEITVKRASRFTLRWVEFDQAMQEQESPTDISSKTTTG